MDSKIYCIGDVHGCYYELRDLLDKIGPGQGDTVYFVGDFLDKGPYGAEVVRFIRESGFKAVKGNHDEIHIRWRKNELLKLTTGRPNNMRPLKPADAAANAKLSQEDLEWLKALPHMVQLWPGNFVTQGEGRHWTSFTQHTHWTLVHGGLMPGVALEQQDLNDVMRLMWVTDEKKFVPVDYAKPELLGYPPKPEAYHWTRKWDGPSNVVFGHEAFNLTQPLWHVNEATGVECWGIDTGAVHGGHLTALCLNTKEIFQVRARKEYCPVPTYIPSTLGFQQAIGRVHGNRQARP